MVDFVDDAKYQLSRSTRLLAAVLARIGHPSPEARLELIVADLDEAPSVRWEKLANGLILLSMPNPFSPTPPEQELLPKPKRKLAKKKSKPAKPVEDPDEEALDKLAKGLRGEL